jgi:hypothetical protein
VHFHVHVLWPWWNSDDGRFAEHVVEQENIAGQWIRRGRFSFLCSYFDLEADFNDQKLMTKGGAYSAALGVSDVEEHLTEVSLRVANPRGEGGGSPVIHLLTWVPIP